MDEKSARWMESLPYPVVAIGPTKKGLHRNRLARCLLPPLSRLKELLASFERWDEEFLREIRLDGIAYLVIVLPQRDGMRLLCFFEHFLPLQEAFSRLIIGEMKDFFWTLLNKEKITASNKNLVHLDQIAAGVCSLRLRGEDYLRLLNVSEIFSDEEMRSCCLDGFFAHLHRALDFRGINVSFCFREGTTVLSEGTVLSFLVLNLVHFVRLFEGDHQICLNATETAEGIRFFIEFSDSGSIASSLESLIRFGKETEELLAVLPLFCVLRVCMEKAIPWSVRQEGEKFRFSFLLAKGDEKPVLFLSDPTAAEVLELLQMAKTIFL